MLQRISKNSRRIAAILSQYRTPTQIASGAAMGVGLGIIPKDNIVFLSLVVFITVLRVNQLLGWFVACSLWFFSAWFEPISHVLGSMLLRQSIVAATVQRLYEYPLLPWTCIDNTLVCGGLAIGIASFLPTYLACCWSHSKAKHQLESHDLSQIANDANRYRKSVLDQSTLRRERPTQALRLVLNEDLVHAESQQPTGRPVAEATLETDLKSDGSKVHAQADVGAANHSTSKFKVHPKQDDELAKVHGSDKIMRETVIEVVRYRRPVSLSRGEKQKTKSPDPSIISLNTGTTMAVANMPPAQSIDGKNGKSDPSPKPVMGHLATITIDAGHSNFYPTNREESLKYLLSHINHARESNRKPSGKSA
ncbi:MAG: hypothetical protein WCK15_15915 [Pirellula sp.]